MNTNKIFSFGALSLIASALLVGCGSSSTPTSTTKTGTFLDAPVAGCQYKTSSGLTGTTNQYGQFQYHQGDSVSLFLGNLHLGEATPLEDGLLTPDELSKGDEEYRLLLLRTLQALDSDNNPSNGIAISQTLLDALSNIEPMQFQTMTEEMLLSLDPTLLALLDENHDGLIDVDESTAITHFEETKTHWQSSDTETISHGNGAFDINALPISTLTQDLKDAIAYMGNEERLAYDIYTNLYDYHLENNHVEIRQLYNIAHNSEIKHVGIVQDIVKKYNLGEDDLTNVEEGVATNDVTFEQMPSGEYDIPEIQALYDTLYAKGVDSQEEALMVGCMVEVTDINDLNQYIVLTQDSNATDVEEAFNILREGSYNHYWAFNRGLKNLGIADGCYVEGDALLGENKEGLYPQR